MFGISGTAFSSLFVCSIFVVANAGDFHLCIFNGSYSNDYYNLDGQRFHEDLGANLKAWNENLQARMANKPSIGVQHTLVLFIDDSNLYDIVYTRRTPDELQACFKLLKDASKTLAQEFNTVIIVKSVNRTEENRRSLFDNTIKQHFKNAVYIPMKGAKVSETDNSPLVAPTKSAFERFLVTVSLVEPDSRA